MITKTQALEKEDIVSVLVYLCFSKVDLEHLPHTR